MWVFQAWKDYRAYTLVTFGLKMVGRHMLVYRGAGATSRQDISAARREQLNKLVEKRVVRNW